MVKLDENRTNIIYVLMIWEFYSGTNLSGKNEWNLYYGSFRVNLEPKYVGIVY